MRWPWSRRKAVAASSQFEQYERGGVLRIPDVVQAEGGCDYCHRPLPAEHMATPDGSTRFCGPVCMMAYTAKTGRAVVANRA